jgi:hypothetical protein
MKTVWILTAATGLVAAGLWAIFFSAGSAPRDRPIPNWPIEGRDFGETPLRIVAFGTSLTAGNDWPRRLGKGLTACLGHPVEMIRVAEPGMGSSWALEHVAEVAAFEPEVVLIEFSINDADLRDGVSRSRGRRQHEALIDSLQKELPEARLVLMTMSPAYGLRGLLRPFLTEHYADVADLAYARDLGLIDLYPRWRNSNVDRPADGLHPDNEATRAVVDAPVLAAFTDALETGCKPPAGGG